MHLLFLDIDDSGDDGRSPASSSHLVLGGLAIRDSEWSPLVGRINTLVTNHLGTAAAKTELHGSDMLSGRGFCRTMTPSTREALFQEWSCPGFVETWRFGFQAASDIKRS